MAGLELGTRYDVDPIPPIEQNTTYLDAGSIKIGVEFRELNEDILADNFAPGSAEAAIVYRDKPESLDDSGFSIHVFDAATNGEWLRFDMFAGEPHYHYIVPGQYNILIPYDENAFGDMFEWVLECLRSRLPQMLRFAGNEELATRVDQAAVDAAIPRIIELTRGVRPALA